MHITADQLITKVLTLAPTASSFWVAYSGGLDSHVLLHALAAARAQLPAPLGAIHVNHNLQADAPRWVEHCRAICAQLQLPFQTLSVQAHPAPGESPEAAARVARYRAMAAALPVGAALLTAHHQDDQAETLLLQLLRGAGPKGLAAMPACSESQGFTLLRPLLEVSRETLREYAQQYALSWVDDPSNAQPDYDRNFLRQQILPQLRTRWPAMTETLARGARHQAEAALLLEQLAEIDLGTDHGFSSCIQAEAREKTVVCPRTLSVAALLCLSAPRRANLLRYWLQQQQVLMPSAAVLERIDQDLLRAGADAQPLVRWGDVRLRRYRDQLFVDDVLEDDDVNRCLDWQPGQSVQLHGGVLNTVQCVGQGIAARHVDNAKLQVRFRQGGEMLQPAGRREHHRLKHLFQDAGVPPWERARVPLIYRGDELLAVAGYWECAEFIAADDEPGVRFAWSRSLLALTSSEK